MSPTPPKSNHDRTSKPRARAKSNQVRADKVRAARNRATQALQPPTPSDVRRYFDWRTGISPAEIAARENVRVSTIETSIERMRNYAAANSAEMAELAIRQVTLATLPGAALVIEGAMTAVHKVPHTVGYDSEGNAQIEYVETADHVTRLEAVDRIQKLFSASQPKTPLVAVSTTVNTQHNQLMAGGGHAGAPAQLSSESFIRQIRAERGLALPSETSSPAQTTAVLVEQDHELLAELEELGELDEDVAAAAVAEAATEVLEGEYQDGADDAAAPE